MKVDTRKIYYIDPNEDPLDLEVKWALQHSMEERFRVFCRHIATIYAMAQIDIKTCPVERKIYYIEDERHS